MIDKRLTKEEKEKIKPVNQGGGPNYLHYSKRTKNFIRC